MSEDLNVVLARNVKAGGKYDKLFPESNCTPQFVGKGMTDYTVKSMVELVKQYHFQAADVAPHLKGKNLEDTCTKIHEFLYNYFQYYADKEDQYLRAPACSWHIRYEGMDCKSYSVLASSILTNLGISHYIRRVRQPNWNPGMWTHVYVIVPKNQQDAALNQGYYVVDGTVREDYETLYVQKDDTLMSMNHYWLTGASGLNGTNWKSISDGIFSGGKISFKSLSCIGGSKDSSDVDEVLPKVIAYFEDTYANINSIIANNQSGLLDKVNELYDTTYKMADHAIATRAYKWSSDCSKKACDAYVALSAHYLNVLTKAFQPWLGQYFNITTTQFTGKNVTYPITTYTNGKGFLQTQFIRDCKITKLTSLVMKSGYQQVVKFELTPYIMTGANYDNSKFNTVQALQGLTTVIASFGSNPGTTTTSTTTNGTTVTTTTGGGGNSSQPANVVTTKDSGTGVLPTPETPAKTSTTTIVVGIAAAAAIAYAVFGRKKTGLSGPRKTTRTTKTRRK